LDREEPFEVTSVGDALPWMIDFNAFVTAGGAQLVRCQTTLAMLDERCRGAPVPRLTSFLRRTRAI
jgi:hypothetical protein